MADARPLHPDSADPAVPRPVDEATNDLARRLGSWLVDVALEGPASGRAGVEAPRLPVEPPAELHRGAAGRQGAR